MSLLKILPMNLFFSFQYSFGADPVTSLLEPLEEELIKTTYTYCGKTHPLFTKKLAHSLADVNRKAPSGRWQKCSTVIGRKGQQERCCALAERLQGWSEQTWPYILVLEQETKQFTSNLASWNLLFKAGLFLPMCKKMEPLQTEAFWVAKICKHYFVDN